MEAEKLFPNQPFDYLYEIDEKPLFADPNHSQAIMIGAQFGAVPLATYALLTSTGPKEQFIIEGTVRPIEPTKLDKNKPVRILIPEDQRFKGKLLEGSGLAIAQKSKEQLAQFFETVTLSNKPGKDGYIVIPNVIRWLDYNPITGLQDIITIEYEIVHSKSKTRLTRFLISEQEKIFTWEKMFSLIPKNYPPDILIAEPLEEKLHIYLDVTAMQAVSPLQRIEEIMVVVHQCPCGAWSYALTPFSDRP